MLKKTSSLLLCVFAFNIAFASTTSLRWNLNEDYNWFIQTSKSVYNNTKSVIQNEKQKIGTWDYKVLSYLTWTSIDSLSEENQTGYQGVIKKLTSSKYDIISKMDVLDTNFSNSFITTWEYKNGLVNISSLISWYNIQANKDINLYKTNINNAIKIYTWAIEIKKEKFKDEIENYKNFENELTVLNSAYKDLEKNNNKIESIIWISKDLLTKKSGEVKDYVNNYFSWYVEKQYQNLIDSDSNFAYFSKDFKNKKEIVLWFVNNKFTDIISSITDTYYPDIRFEDVKNQVNDVNNLSVNDIVKNYQTIKDNIQKTKQTIKNYADKLSWKLAKFNNSTDKTNILKVLQNDIVSGIKNTLPTVENELNTTFKNWKDFITKKEKQEENIMNTILISYNNVMTSWSIENLKSFGKTLEDYKDILILPTNLEKIRKYKLAIEQKIEDVKYKQFTDQLNNIENTIKNFKIWDNKEKIAQIKSKLKAFGDYKVFSTKIKDINLKLKLQENLDNLYKLWAIRYYYQYGDLSDTVSNILTKYYDKYKKAGKKDIFEQKINTAFEKIDILTSSLSNDKRSYYIIMIYNGLLKFQSNNL